MQSHILEGSRNAMNFLTKCRANAFGKLSKLDDGIADLTQAILLNPRELQYYRFR